MCCHVPLFSGIVAFIYRPVTALQGHFEGLENICSVIAFAHVSMEADR